MDICYYRLKEFLVVIMDAEYHYTGSNLKTLSIVNLFKRQIMCKLQWHRSTALGLLRIGDLTSKSIETVGMTVYRFMSIGACIEIIETKELQKVGRVWFSGGSSEDCLFPKVSKYMDRHQKFSSRFC